VPPELVEQLRAWVTSVARAEVERALQEGARVPEYLSTKDAAALAKVSVATVRRWISEGRLERHGAGREIRVSRDQLQGLMRPGKRQRPRRVVRKVSRRSPEEEAFAALGL
jgi:excisionase family DNA binding protein